MSDFVKNPNAAGKNIIRVLQDKLAGDADSFRSAIVVSPDGTESTRLDTKGGNPRALVTRNAAADTCVLFPLREIDATGEETQGARLYYHDTDEELPERLTFTTDGLFSLIAKPLKRILLKSAIAGLNLDVWLADPTVEPNKHPLKLANLPSVNLDELDPSETLRQPGATCYEVLRRSPGTKPYTDDELMLVDDSEGAALRRYYAPTLLTSKSPKDAGDNSTYMGLGFLMARLKRVVFKVTGSGKYDGVYRVNFGRYNNNLRKADSPGVMGVAKEKNLLKREYVAGAGSTPSLRAVYFAQGKLTLALPGGLLQHNEVSKFGQAIAPAERIVNPDESASFIAFDDISHCIAFGQYRHGPFNHSDRMLLSSDYTHVQMTLEGEDSGAFSVGLNNPGTLQYVCFYDSAEVEADSMLPKNTRYNDELLKGQADLRKGAVLLMGRYGLSASSPKVFGVGPDNLPTGLRFPIKNEDGSVHCISVTLGIVTGAAIASYKGRTDKYFFETNHATDDIEIARSPAFEIPQEYDLGTIDSPGWLSGLFLANIAHSPSGRKCVAGRWLFTFTGDGGDGLTATVTAAYTPIWVRRQWAKKRTPEEIAEIPDSLIGNDVDLSGSFTFTKTEIGIYPPGTTYSAPPPAAYTVVNKTGRRESYVKTISSNGSTLTVVQSASGNYMQGAGEITYTSSWAHVPGGEGGIGTTVLKTVGEYAITEIKDSRLFNPFGNYMPRYMRSGLLEFYYDREEDKFKAVEYVYKYWRVETITTSANVDLTHTVVADLTTSPVVVTETGSQQFQSNLTEEGKFFAEIQVLCDGDIVITRQWEVLGFTKSASIPTSEVLYPNDDYTEYPRIYHTEFDEPIWQLSEHHILGRLFTSSRHPAESPVVRKLVWPGAPDTYIYGPQAVTLEPGETLHYDPWTNTIGKNSHGVSIIF